MADKRFALASAQEAKAAEEALLLQKKKKPPKKFEEIDIYIPVDFSFLKLEKLEDAESENPRLPVMTEQRNPKILFEGNCLRLNNNALQDVSTLSEFAKKLFEEPMTLTWIDLSFNQLQTIDPVLLEFKELKILYLHGNKIKSLKEVDKLSSLPKLFKITLHGNPIEDEKDSRLYVASILPHVKSISFSAVTKCQAKTAHTWRTINNPDKKKKKKARVDD